MKPGTTPHRYDVITLLPPIRTSLYLEDLGGDLETGERTGEQLKNLEYLGELKTLGLSRSL